MNSRIKAVLAGAACIAAIAVGRADLSIVPGPTVGRAAPENAVAGPAPSPEYVWMSGQWVSENGQWRWVAAHWELPPNRSALWVPGHWVPQNGQWAWMNGAWNAPGSQQSPSAPPAPPGGPTAAQYPAQDQAVPTPGTPAPYVAGDYSTAVDPSVDYSMVYPYYGAYWAPWGYYPWLDFGLGWGFGGYGYRGHGGYYGHGGYGHWSHAGAVGRGGAVAHGGHVR